MSTTAHHPLYTPEQKRRRDASVWTLVQGLLAPFQFLVFLVSLTLVLRCLATGAGESAALVSVVVKTLVLYSPAFYNSDIGADSLGANGISLDALHGLKLASCLVDPLKRPTP